MSDSVLDRGGAVREGEGLDAAAVTAWLEAQGVVLEGSAAVTQFAGGASNWTYRLEYANRDLILRRPPSGTKAKGAHDMGREYTVQSALRPIYPYVPNMVGFCSDVSVIGSEFYVMDRIAGIIPRKNLPPGMTLSPAQTRQLCRNMLDRLIALHRVDVRATPLEKLGKGSGYVQRQIDGWNARWAKVPTWNVLKFQDVQDWLKANMPNDVANGVIHNDWRFDNLVLSAEDPTQIIGVLDWEMATLGDPLMELGCVIAYWNEAGDDRIAQFMRRQPTHLPGMFTRREVVDYYLEHSGLKCDNWAFYEAYGLFRLAVIIQQIYYRYHHRQTHNPAFKPFWIMANYLGWRARRVIKKANH